ncbi:MAG: Na(+)-translocating NADH-quinone reductase subunit A [Cytophagales bacterium]|nr:MAG: Na(+)-translocating NADH-quinone reductase subunit A [Cytophagales bacterium]
MRKKLSKGFDIALKGKALPNTTTEPNTDLYAFKPTDFNGIKRPKVTVQQGDKVEAGATIFFDKANPKAKFASPVSGEVVEVIRGEKRVPLEIRILADKETLYRKFPTYAIDDIQGLSKERITEILAESGVWPNFIERPFGNIPNPDETPRDIFITTFDSHPLAPDLNYVFQDEQKYLQAGINALKKLTKGAIHLSLNAKAQNNPFQKLQNVTFHEFAGPHPAGNVGVQIHHIAPINKGEIVWTISLYGLQQIGRLFLEGRYDARKTIAVVGSEVKKPQYHTIISGANIKNLLQNNLTQDNVRVISGNVLTGDKIKNDGFLSFYATQITVIPEGNYHEFLGWILPSTKKLSLHRAFGLFSFLAPQKERVLDSNLHGEERAFVETGLFEKLIPMDIYVIYLLKAIMINDFEEMEALGIYEILEEDIALCEFADVSKMEIQKLLRQGLNALQEA